MRMEQNGQCVEHDMEEPCGACAHEADTATHDPISSDSRNEWELPSTLGFSYVDVRSMSDETIIMAGLDSDDRLTAELANRLDLALEPCK